LKWKFRPKKLKTCGGMFQIDHRQLSYVEKVIPKNQFLINNFEVAPHSSKSEASAEEKIMGRVIHIDFGQHKQPLSSESIKPSQELDSIISARPKADETGVVIESSQLLNDLDEGESTSEVENILKSISENTLNQYRSFDDLTIVPNTSDLSKRILPDRENLIITQEGFSLEHPERTNWIYLYNLPYDLEEYGYEKLKKEIIEKVGSFGNIKRIKFYSYKDFRTVFTNTTELLIPKNITETFNQETSMPFQLETLSLEKVEGPVYMSFYHSNEDSELPGVKDLEGEDNGQESSHEFVATASKPRKTRIT